MKNTGEKRDLFAAKSGIFSRSIVHWHRVIRRIKRGSLFCAFLFYQSWSYLPYECDGKQTNQSSYTPFLLEIFLVCATTNSLSENLCMFAVWSYGSIITKIMTLWRNKRRFTLWKYLGSIGLHWPIPLEVLSANISYKNTYAAYVLCISIRINLKPNSLGIYHSDGTKIW